jgi:hypothetical protein
MAGEGTVELSHGTASSEGGGDLGAKAGKGQREGFRFGRVVVFINHNRKRTSRQVGSKKGAQGPRDHRSETEIRQDYFSGEKATVRTLNQYYQRFKNAYLELADGNVQVTRWHDLG